MTNHDMLAFIYGNGPCTHIDIEFEFGCSSAQVAFRGTDLMVIGLIDYDEELGTFFYSGDSWVAQP